MSNFRFDSSLQLPIHTLLGTFLTDKDIKVMKLRGIKLWNSYTGREDLSVDRDVYLIDGNVLDFYCFTNAVPYDIYMSMILESNGNDVEIDVGKYVDDEFVREYTLNNLEKNCKRISA